MCGVGVMCDVYVVCVVETMWGLCVVPGLFACVALHTWGDVVYVTWCVGHGLCVRMYRVVCTAHMPTHGGRRE